ncbi:large ribosomal subunit protein mL39 isoform X1 [Saimiri boliviensis]|uniref:large ribosomal subunit protein mL39 isoform X1 n=1 Tax=Saimiri boliviensis TaxID=27679 RepID=UPI003D77ADF5
MEALAMGVRAVRLLRVAPSGGVSRRFIATSPASQLSPTELTEMRNDLFNKEKARQLSLTPRTEKIEVKHVGKTDPGTIFMMNKNISTPYSCAMHLSEWYCRKSILALVDGQPWGMYKPLTKSCEIQFLTFKDRDPGEVNKAYWRSCAMMMGCVIERAFKDEYMVNLVRAPEVPVISGAFCYDVLLDSRLDEWIPTKENLRSFTKDAHVLIYKDLPFETLEVDAKVALEIFQHNKYKIDFIEEKASQNPERIVKLHRIGDFIDVSEGPLIPRTSICFQYEISAVHSLQPTQPSLIRRFQGLSLPVHLRAHFTIWDKLLERSRKMVEEVLLTNMLKSVFQLGFILPITFRRKGEKNLIKSNRRESFKKEVVTNTKISHDIQEEKNRNMKPHSVKTSARFHWPEHSHAATPG